ncbi:MAG: hypothetical protein V3U65_08545 [Granulosicoccaceae bacterium]
MIRSAQIVCGLLAITAFLSLSACSREETSAPTVESAEIELILDSNTAVIGASEIPYPVYPNGTKYRVGGENGLKIVVFETNDPFEEVDKFYNGEVQEEGMARLTALNDYVRYSQNGIDVDPWATHRPGIVIHQFQNDAERQAVGADISAKTNIIMSF